MTETNPSPNRWVLAWKPYDPDGLFVQNIGDLSKGDNAIVAVYNVAKAKRMSKSEAYFLLDCIRSDPSMTFGNKLEAVNLKEVNLV